MPFIKSVFLHFFDIHYLEEKRVDKFLQQATFEAFWATRFSILSAYEVLIPASSFFESKLCRKIISQYRELFDSGIIILVSNNHNIEEFLEEKLIQYNENDEQFSIYKEALHSMDLCLPMRKRQRSSTLDIVKDWRLILNSGKFINEITSHQKVDLPRDFEDRWYRVPDKLEKRAFIVPNVIPLLITNSNLFIEDKLHGIINKAYFNSYIEDLKSGIVSDLVYLEPNYQLLTAGNMIIPYKFILRELKKRNLLDYVSALNNNDLIQYGESDEWKDIFFSALKNRQLLLKDLQYIHSRKQISEGVIIMGDQYNITSHGQIGAIGNKASANHAIFNQDKIDFEKLASEIKMLYDELRKNASTEIELKDLQYLKNALEGIKSDNKNKILSNLSKVGKWAVDAANKIGLSLVTEILKSFIQS